MYRLKSRHAWNAMPICSRKRSIVASTTTNWKLYMYSHVHKSGSSRAA